MATSPNYSWPEPDNTDLVKNGALSIRTMGNAIDTTMATMTPKSTYTAKGSIAAATGASTPANLSVGNNGETLVADSSTSTGLRYTAGTVQANPILNSAMQVWQRGTSIAFSGSGGYAMDRYYVNSYPASTIARQVTGDTTNLPFIQYCARVQRNSGSTNTGELQISQSIETLNSIPFVGKTVTYSFYARKGANYSATSSLLSVGLLSGTGTDQNVKGTWTGSAVVGETTQTLTTTWQRFSQTGTVASTANELAFYAGFSGTGTAGAADYFEITGIQIDIGSVALPFRTYAGTIQGELAACQRYLPAIFVNTENFGFAFSTTGTQFYGTFGVTPRVAPTGLTISNLSDFTVYNQGFGSGTPTAIIRNTASTSTYSFTVTTTAASPTIVTGQPAKMQLTGANGYALFTGCEL